MQFVKSDASYVLKIERGENVVASITEFCERHEIGNAHFVGIGAVEWVKCGYYDRNEKKYYFEEIAEVVEVLNLTGNVMLKNDKPFVHAHGTFGRRNLTTFGGHVEEAIVGITLEIILTPLSSLLTRTYDDDIGLFLIDFP